ncbi:two-component system response regulator CreB [Undibacterium sp.]|uniref:two-component system response regulator CreB n=1 Tax=Undibacterium sp. TaxID=1914977 RepID=UPI0025E4C822|nr:two-component system response regulator CreB [Undibacterium sp.]
MSTTILIVEDETAIADTLCYALATDGLKPHHVTLGQQALDLLREPAALAPALIVLDVGLPDISGFEVCRRLRQFSNIPVIFLTARSDEIDRIVGLEIGADDYVSKPFSPRELVARIRAVLRRPPLAASVSELQPAASALAAAATTAARFELRSEEARILYFGQPLNLTRYEYALLKVLIERPRQLFSRAQLMDMVWTNAPETLERTVDAHIKSLRAKLRVLQPDDDPILTQRGMGYSLAPL